MWLQEDLERPFVSSLQDTNDFLYAPNFACSHGLAISRGMLTLHFKDCTFDHETCAPEGPEREFGRKPGYYASPLPLQGGLANFHHDVNEL